MTRTVSGPTTTASGQLVTRPGYLVEIGFDPFLLLSSRGSVTAMSNYWTGWDVRISGLANDADRPAGGGSMTLGDADQSISAMVLSQGLAGREVTIWRYFAGAVADADPVVVFNGIAGRVSGGMSREITVALVARESSTLFSPRRYMTKETGFSALPAAGQVFVFNNEKYVLQPEL